MPQRRVLGPLLFIAFINDLPETTCSKIKLFAEDSLIYYDTKSKADARLLQQDLLFLEHWAKDLHMVYNLNKCVVFSIKRQMKSIKTNYTFHGHVLEEVESSKYLGVTLTVSNDLKCNKHIEMVISEANRTLGFLRHKMRGCKT